MLKSSAVFYLSIVSFFIGSGPLNTVIGGSLVAATSLNDFAEERNDERGSIVSRMNVAELLKQQDLGTSQESLHTESVLDWKESVSAKYLLALDAEDPEVNCTTINHVWAMAHSDEDPDMEGSMVESLKMQCDEGAISTAEDVVLEQARLERLATRTIEEQLEYAANEICTSNLVQTSSNALVQACAEDPRDADTVVEAAAIQAESHEGNNSTDDEMENTCLSIEEHRGEIEAAMMALEASNERRLGMSPDVSPITSVKIGEDMLNVYDILCDNNNPNNEGLTRMTITFAEDIGSAINDQAKEDFDEAYMEKLHSSLEKQTSHIRRPNSAPRTGNSADTSVARALPELETGGNIRKCVPPIFDWNDVTKTGSLCLAAGVVDCNIAWSDGSPTCAVGSCSAGSFVTIGAEFKVCPVSGPSCTPASGCAWSDPSVTLELKICVQAVSELLEAIGLYVPGAEKLMNSFSIYSGCYRIGIATYNIAHNRLEISVTPLKRSVFANVFVSVGGHANFRFKGEGCPYDDSWLWFMREYSVKYCDGGNCFNHGTVGYFQHELASLDNWNTNRCPWRTEGWAQFSVNFKVYLDWLVDVTPIFSSPHDFKVIV